MGKRAKSLLKRNDSYKFNVGLGKKKKDDNIKAKISSNRMTIIPGFLSRGLKSEVAIKDKGDQDKNRENILNEDLHSLFSSNANSQNFSVRRSARISKRDSICYAESKTKRNCEVKSLNRSDCNYTLRSETKGTVTLDTDLGFKENALCRNSKSLFQKIRSAKTNFSNNSLLISLLSTKTQIVAKEFNTDLFRKIQINFKFDIIEGTRKKIYDEIERVNNKLTGIKSSTAMMGSYRTFAHENSDREFELPEYLVPCRDWQYATPPSQKLNMMYYEESAIQPAIFCADGTGRNIYELKRNIDASLVNHIDPRSVEVDNRYMQHIAGFDRENCPVDGLSWSDMDRLEDGENNAVNYNKNSLSHIIKEHLKTIHARPRKTVKKLKFADAFSRNEMFCKGKDHLKPSTSNVPNSMDFTFVNCTLDDGNYDSPKNKFKMARKLNMFKQMEGQDFFQGFEISDDETLVTSESF